MKRKVLISLLFLMVLCFVKGQNLVPNYSFEIKTQCASGVNQFQGYVSYWLDNESGLSYFDSLCNNSNVDVNIPLNDWGYQYPHTGVAYAGIYTFIAFPPPFRPYDHNLRDYLQVKLYDSLKPSTKYFVTFYASLADSSKWACNSIGAYFSDSLLTSTSLVKSYLAPQIENDTANELTDKINWMKISGSFIAKGGETYIAIGNFKNDKHSDSLFVGSPSSNSNHNWNNSYYYIDDVIVSIDSNYADSLESVNQLTSKNGQLKVYPNPSNGVFTLTQPSPSGEGASVVDIYNMMGERIYEALLPQTPEGVLSTIDISKQPAGIYLYRVTTTNGDAIGSGKLIIE